MVSLDSWMLPRHHLRRSHIVPARGHQLDRPLEVPWHEVYRLCATWDASRLFSLLCVCTWVHVCLCVASTCHVVDWLYCIHVAFLLLFFSTLYRDVWQIHLWRQVTCTVQWRVWLTMYHYQKVRQHAPGTSSIPRHGLSVYIRSWFIDSFQQQYVVHLLTRYTVAIFFTFLLLSVFMYRHHLVFGFIQFMAM